MAEDLADLIATLDGLVDGQKRKRMERKALRAVADVVQPALTAATPVSGGAAGSHGPLPEGALRNAVQSRIAGGGDDGKEPSLVVGFGKLSHIARFVDEGHRNPTASRPGKLAFTPPHPFVRAVEEATAAEAQEIFVATMNEEIQKELARHA